MTTNNPGIVNQQLLYGCTSCYEDWTWPAGDLRVYENECWCKPCWDERRWEFPDLPGWNDLEPYTPALQAERDALTAECEKLRKDVTALVEALELAAKTLILANLEGEVTRRIDSALAAHQQGGEE